MNAGPGSPTSDAPNGFRLNELPNIPYDEAWQLTTGCLHPARSMGQADLYTLDWQGRPALLKDFTARPLPIRFFLSRFVLTRELRALQTLAGLPGIPQLYGRAGKHAFLMERLDAKRLPRNRETPPPPDFFDRARALLDSIHARGVGHGDLRRKNILIDSENRPYLIDFATAVVARPDASGAFSQWLYRRVTDVDLFTLARIKSEFYPDRLTDEERQRLASAPWYLRLGRFLKKNVYRLRKPHHRRAVMRRMRERLRSNTKS